jgi:putative NADPH-quinone reductase
MPHPQADLHTAAMGKRVLIIDGHPDVRAGRFVHAIADAYAAGAHQGGHETRTIAVAALDFPLLRTNDDFQSGATPEAIRSGQEALTWADHLVIVFPLWLNSMPALLKAFLEQLLRPGFAFAAASRGFPKKLLRGRSARVVVTMGMPALLYRVYCRSRALKSLERNVLAFCGISPVRSSVIGSIETAGMQRRAAWLGRMRKLGRDAR